MPFVTVNSTTGGAGTYTLAAADSLIEGSAGLIYSNDSQAITGGGSGQVLILNGTVASAVGDGVHLGGGTSANMTVTVGSTGHIEGGDDGISMYGSQSTVNNHGTVHGGVYGIFIGADLGGTSTILNTGRIIGTYYGIVEQTGTEEAAIHLVNTGLISGPIASLYASAVDDIVENHGVMRGDVNLVAGDDTFDGRDGREFGTIYGGAGNDRFTLGNAAEWIDGDIGNDVLDFSGAGTVHVALDGSFANTGAAAGDEYVGIEAVNGSRRSDDLLAGDANANTLFGDSGADKLWGRNGDDTLLGGLGNDSLDGSQGKDVLNGDDGDDLVYGGANNDLIYGGGDPFTTNSDNDQLYGDAGNDVIQGQRGADAIYGGTGNDVITGGAGADTLHGDAGSDVFAFMASTEFGDNIIDFHNGAGDNDSLQVSHLIGGGLTVGALAAAKFWATTTNHAHDASDRFIFRTTDATLWFDANGNAAGGPVMVADLQAGAVVTAGDIIIT